MQRCLYNPTTNIVNVTYAASVLLHIGNHGVNVKCGFSEASSKCSPFKVLKGSNVPRFRLKHHVKRKGADGKRIYEACIHTWYLCLLLAWEYMQDTYIYRCFLIVHQYLEYFWNTKKWFYIYTVRSLGSIRDV